MHRSKAAPQQCCQQCRQRRSRCCLCAVAPCLRAHLALTRVAPPPPSPSPPTHTPQTPTAYTQLAPTKGQWKIAVATTKGSPDAFTPQTCDKDTISAPCLQPLLTADKGDRVQVSLSLKDKVLKTVDNLQPKRVLVRACYARPSLVGRPWRAANNNIDVSVCVCVCRKGCLVG